MFRMYFYAYGIGALLMAMFVRVTLPRTTLLDDVPRQDLALWVWPIIFGLLWPLVLLIVITELGS